MGQLLLEYDAVLITRPDLDVTVQVKSGNKFVKMPEWLINSRHPDRAAIDAALAGRE
jgi:hypothetical protein